MDVDEVQEMDVETKLVIISVNRNAQLFNTIEEATVALVLFLCCV